MLNRHSGVSSPAVGPDRTATPGPHQAPIPKRVALARALAAEPHVLLLDGPFSALDAALRDTMHQLLRRIRAELHPTIVLVTHDQHEAVAALGDTIAVLRQGELLQHDTADQLYSRPRSEIVHRLMGGQERHSRHDQGRHPPLRPRPSRPSGRPDRL